MHKDDAAKLFGILADGDRVKTLKKLYMLKSLSLDDLKEIIGSSDTKFNNDIKLLLDSNLIKKDGNNFIPNNEQIDELMNFIKTPCSCSKNKTKFTVVAYDLEFAFEKDELDCAWYDFDHMVSKNGSATLRIDANREVYAFFKKDDTAKEIQGTIQDDDDNILPDNYSVDNDYQYHFIECEKQGYFV